MGRYIGTTDINNIFGASNVAKWSSLDNWDETDAPDSSRITESITFAEDYFDDRLRDSRYATPLTGTIPSTVKRVCAIYAGLWLYDSRAGDDIDIDTNRPIDKYLRHRRWAERMIDKILRNEVRIDSPEETTEPTAPTVVD